MITDLEKTRNRELLERCENIIRSNGITWDDIDMACGKNIRKDILSGKADDAELEMFCRIMNADMRYLLMERDSWNIDPNDPVSFLRKEKAVKPKRNENTVWKQQELNLDIGQPEEDTQKPADCEKKTDNNIKQPEKPLKKKQAVKKQQGMKFTEFEPNEIVQDRLREFVNRNGVNFHAVNSLIGNRGESIASFATGKQLPKGTTATLAWMCGTTPAYLTGRSDSKTKGASRVRRPVMEGQTVMTNHKKLIGHEDDLTKRNGMTKDMAAWLMTGDRLVTELFLERVAASIGCRPKQLMKRNPVMYKYDDPILGLYDKWESEQELKKQRKAKRMQKASEETSENQSSSKGKPVDGTNETVSNEYQNVVNDNYGVDALPNAGADPADDCKDAVSENDIENDDSGTRVKSGIETGAGDNAKESCDEEETGTEEENENMTEDETGSEQGMTLNDLFNTLDQLPMESLDAIDDYIKSLRSMRNAIKENQKLRDKLIN